MNNFIHAKPNSSKVLNFEFDLSVLNNSFWNIHDYKVHAKWKIIIQKHKTGITMYKNVKAGFSLSTNVSSS